MNNGLLLVYTGDGKGKTTASLGLAMRACGQGLNVTVLQYMKKGDTGEVIFSRKHGEPLVIPMGMGTMVKSKQINTRETINCAISYTLARAIIELDIFDIVILDEIGIASYFGLIDSSALIKLAEERPNNLTIVMTGRKIPQQIIKQSDIVSKINEIKYTSGKGIKPRKGIEF
jgi:cob(I)alamin adenosyltransferase